MATLTIRNRIPFSGISRGPRRLRSSALSHDPEKLQTFRTRSCAKPKKIASVVGSTLSKNTLELQQGIEHMMTTIRPTIRLAVAAVAASLMLAPAAPARADEFSDPQKSE